MSGAGVLGAVGLACAKSASDGPVIGLALGSGAARGLAGRTWTAPVLGRSSHLLQRGFERWDGSPPVGMVAGNVAHGLGHFFARFDGESDGTVAVAETRLPGLADHCVVASSHSGLVFSAEAARQAVAFLRDGHFSVPG